MVLVSPRGIQYSFLQEPDLDLVVRPLGAASFASEMKFIVKMVRDLLAGLITKRLVEPERRTVDMGRIYRNRHVARVRGEGGGVWGGVGWGKLVRGRQWI